MIDTANTLGLAPTIRAAQVGLFAGAQPQREQRQQEGRQVGPPSALPEVLRWGQPGAGPTPARTSAVGTSREWWGLRRLRVQPVPDQQGAP